MGFSIDSDLAAPALSEGERCTGFCEDLVCKSAVFARLNWSCEEIVLLSRVKGPLKPSGVLAQDLKDTRNCAGATAEREMLLVRPPDRRAESESTESHCLGPLRSALTAQSPTDVQSIIAFCTAL